MLFQDSIEALGDIFHSRVSAFTSFELKRAEPKLKHK